MEDKAAFQLVDGPLLDLAQKADADRDHIYVLLIDELNRGNVAKVFGELYFLLEYRGERVRLQYGSGASDPDFALPENLWFIGTMNTADQSIALLDSALRRRFYFVDFYPTEPPIEGLLRTWLEQNGYAAFIWLADVIDEVNRRLGDREIALGPSYFLDPDHELTKSGSRASGATPSSPISKNSSSVARNYARITSSRRCDRPCRDGRPAGARGTSRATTVRGRDWRVAMRATIELTEYRDSVAVRPSAPRTRGTWAASARPDD